MSEYAGMLCGRMVSAIAEYIVYDHHRNSVYLESNNRFLVMDVVRTQRACSIETGHKAYAWVRGEWREVLVENLSVLR